MNDVYARAMAQQLTTQLAHIVMDVKSAQFGAKGDGVTDDTTAIQNAINYAVSNKGKVFFPAGTYLITHSLNLTNISNGLILEGQGMGENGTVILGHTGNVIIDRTGSEHVLLRNIKLKSDTTANASTIGILDARSSTNQYAQFNNMENVRISIPSNPSANSGNGTIGIYNYGAELWRARNIYVDADRPVCFVINNTFNITSPNTTINSSGVSMSECVIDGSSTLTGYANASVRLDNTANIKLDNIYILLGQADGTNNQFAIECINGQTSLHITGHIEGYEQFINGKGALLYNPFINVSKQIMTANKDQIVLDGSTSATGIYGGSIGLVNMLNTTYAHNLISQTGSNHNGMVNCNINLLSNQGINCPYGYTTGNIIQSQDPTPSINLSSAGYNNGTLIMKQTGASFNGGIAVSGYSTASRPANLPPNSMIIDTTLGKPVWFIGGVWKDATGVTV